ncbi:conserved hypothetical protein [Shewanella denitrificans OS217]|jgi:hypothetical protein|uniref:Uncharacterized protein n=1 Tax=Shewanella denitrificans (strain OS217 / ATCC BAA-1090 / DSM 15013) TaxID=318161 RepID=Q12JQ8_SHEDO|nr:hypothetical protein [Shewanella denitrificans]ABE56318.1 conserved hypothetical protein [Shewanella denitrificans OS217]
MTTSLIEITAQEIKQLADVEPKQASKRFEIIANTMTDAQLVEVIEHMDIVTLTQINSHHDISCPSIMSELMSPEQIRDIVCQQPLYWEEQVKTNADELIAHTFEFLTYLIRIQESEEKQAAILECIAEDPAGLFYLSIPFIELILAPSEFNEDGGHELHDDEDDGTTVGFDSWHASEESHSLGIDDPRSLMALIQELAPEVAKSIKNLLRNESSGWEQIISKFVNELVLQAKEKNQVADEYAEVDDMFSFLD